MPFIKEDRRKAIDKLGLQVLDTMLSTFNGIQPGDRCYFYYKQMVDIWKENPRWTTAHEIYTTMERDTEPVVENRYLCQFGPRQPKVLYHMKEQDRMAYKLAWQVFFNLYVMPYELKKRKENGDIK